MKKAETQEQEFLEVCSSYDHDLLTGKKQLYWNIKFRTFYYKCNHNK